MNEQDRSRLGTEALALVRNIVNGAYRHEVEGVDFAELFARPLFQEAKRIGSELDKAEKGGAFMEKAEELVRKALEAGEKYKKGLGR